jgi:transposase
VRAHQDASGGRAEDIGRSRGGLSTKIHALCDGLGNPVKLLLSFQKLKRFRRIATRYEKKARNFLAFVHLASILIWLA